jgi:acyl-coenzyme A thioesterase PaaI-like protein
MERAAADWPPAGAAAAVRAASAPPPGTELPSHYPRCFGCGPEAVGGLRLRLHVGEGLTVHGLLHVTEDHQGAPGLAHGGLLATAVDEVLGSLNWLLAGPAVTASLTVDFRRPVPVGTALHLLARVEGRDGRKVFSSGTATVGAPDGPVALTARATFVQVPLEHFRSHGRRQDVAAAAGRMEINP